MDRMISLLAALVGLIALGGAILVHTNGDVQRTQMASQIAQLKVSVDLLTQQTAGGRVAQTPAPSMPSVEPPISEYVAAEVPSSSLAPSSSTSSSLAPPPPLLASSAALAPSSEAPAASSEPPVAASASSAEAGSQTADVKALQDRISSLEQAMAAQASQLEAAKAQPTLPMPTGDSGAASTAVAAVAPSDGAAPAALAADGPTKDCIPIGTRFMATSGDNFPICKTKVVVKVASVSDGFATIGGAGDISAGASGTLAKGCNIMVFSADTTGYAEMRVTCQ